MFRPDSTPLTQLEYIEHLEDRLVRLEADVTSRGLEITRLRDELAEAKKDIKLFAAQAYDADAERDEYQSDWLSASKTVVDYELEIDRLRELVYAVKDPMEDGGCFGSIYCKDVHGVNWFDARDALKGGSKS